MTFPGSGSHSPQRGPQGPGVWRNTAHGDQEAQAVTRPGPVTLTPAPEPEAGRREQQRRGTHRTEAGPPAGTQAAAGHEQGRKAATAAAPAPQQQAAVSHGGPGPLPGARRHGAKAGGLRPAASRFSRNCAPPAQETRGRTRTHAPRVLVRPRPSVRTSTCPLGGRPRPRVG